MSVKIYFFLSIFFTALALGPGLAHLFELPNKINLPDEAYLTVQQIYRGWALLGIIVLIQLFSTAALTIALKHNPRSFKLSFFSLICIIGTQAVFWIFTYPANQATNNWTILPDNWIALRNRWEYSHAAGAILNMTAIIVLILSLLAGDIEDL